MLVYRSVDDSKCIIDSGKKKPSKYQIHHLSQCISYWKSGGFTASHVRENRRVEKWMFHARNEETQNISKSVQVCSWSTPLKTTGWNLTNQPIEKEDHLPSTSILGFKMLIYQAVSLVCKSASLGICNPLFDLLELLPSFRKKTKHPMESPSDSTSFLT